MLGMTRTVQEGGAQCDVNLRVGGGAWGGCRHHVMNLGHGIEATTPEENAKYFVDTVQAYRHH